LFTLVLVFVILPGSSAGQVASRPAAIGKPSALRWGSVQAFAPGQILVRFKSDTSLQAATSLVALYSAMPMYHVAGRTFTLAVPEGQEPELAKILASDPATQYASLNYWITEPSIARLESMAEESLPQAGPTPTQGQPGCITDLWMEHHGEEVYAVFEYTDCDHEVIRLQVFYLDADAAPVTIFETGPIIINGSGVQRVRIGRAVPIPVGRYLTVLSIWSGEGWDAVKTVLWRVSTIPNDPCFPYQWPLHSAGGRASPEAGINVRQAWDITTGSPDLIIAVVSTGVAIDHPDLKNKIWTNHDEIPGNGIDDDENGCVDDVHGCWFFNGEATADLTDTAGWGTLTSSIAAAETNNGIGMAGVSWGARIMPIKVLRLLPGDVLGGYVADMIRAIDYAVANGARIIHLGPRVGDVSDALLELLRAKIDYAVSKGVLVVAGAGDEGEDHLAYPAGFENVVAVGATGPRNQRAWFSNYGTGIDLVAPGGLIACPDLPEQSRWPALSNGTNLAAAYVEGVASLIWSVNPGLSPGEVRTVLRESAVDLGRPGYDEEYGYG
ncbi:MAG: S8 family serine peptidase, partial [Candidatus Bipolaricaulia bacterium]